MSPGYVTSLALVVAVVLVGASMFRASSLSRVALPLTIIEAVVAAVGLVGLVLHCGAMFFRSRVEAVPGLDAVVRQIDALGTASVGWYLAPAMLVLLALRRQTSITILVVSLALAGVGVTMYDGGPAGVHLAVIFAALLVPVTWGRRTRESAT